MLICRLYPFPCDLGIGLRINIKAIKLHASAADLFYVVYSFGVLEVLKQVWDLSDQDSDSMLSLREFCIALYLMERYREGRPLPSVLPSTVMYDETLMRATGMPSAAYVTPTWQPGMFCHLSHFLISVCIVLSSSLLGLPQGLPGSHPVMQATGIRVPRQAFSERQLAQQNLVNPGLSSQIVKNVGKDAQSTVNSDQEAAIFDSKVNSICSDFLVYLTKMKLFNMINVCVISAILMICSIHAH